MKELSLDEYRLMMGTQLWLKESFFTFLETLLGGKSTSPGSVSELDGELGRLTEELSRKTRSTTKPKIDKELNKVNEKLRSKVLKTDEDMQTGKQKSEATRTQGNAVDLSKWSVLVHDNSQKRDEKVNSLNDKLRSYTERGYVK